MRKDDLEKTAKLARDLSDSLDRAARQFLETIREPLGKLERALRRISDNEQTQARLEALHRLDPLRGDYQHRGNGKRPVSGRFRFYDEEPSPLTQSQVEYLRRRAHREKSDLRHGRRE